MRFFLPPPLLITISFIQTTFSECTLQISSKNGKSGKIASSQLASRSSSLPSKCVIVFEGNQNEKVSVRFTYFNLYAPEHANTTKRCAEYDHLTAAVRVGARFSRIDTWCSKDVPPQLMSSSNILQMEYNTKSSRAVRESASQEVGFRLEYNFHADWNMGEMEAQYDSSRGCRFVFNSSRKESGKLWSINYPGLYPRNLLCEYIFHGREDQIVHIHFEYFDVEGFNQCDEQSQSDFVLFSNYQSPDRNNRRVCGRFLPRISTMSESNYYRMVFSTNEIFDATGFYAHYQFLSAHQNPTISKVKFTPSAASSTHCSVALLLLYALISANA
ncbi:unnamed protein product, partial [Mesorhabditis spiculigera]